MTKLCSQVRVKYDVGKCQIRSDFSSNPLVKCKPEHKLAAPIVKTLANVGNG